MEATRRERKPGDLILDRYMPTATNAEREAARDNLYAFSAVILRMCTRIAHERRESMIRAQEQREVQFRDEPSSPV